MRCNTILTAFTVTSLIIYSTPAFAELISVSVGVPFSHTLTGKDVEDKEIKSDGISSGAFIQIDMPFLPGIGIDSYKTKIKNSDPDLATTIFNLFYLLPIPVINLTFGVGIGSTRLQCESCDNYYEQGSATQWFTSFGMPLMPLFDLHLSYRSVSSKIEIKAVDDDAGKKNDLSGNVMGLGIRFSF